MESTSKIATAKTLITFADLVKVWQNMLSFDSRTTNIMKFAQKKFYMCVRGINALTKKSQRGGRNHHDFDPPFGHAQKLPKMIKTDQTLTEATGH